MEITPFFAPVISGDFQDIVKKDFPNKVGLIDADRYKHLVAYRMYQKMMDEGLDHSKELLNEIIEDYLSRDIFNNFTCKAYVFCFSAPSKDVFRHSIAQNKKYKGNREGKTDPNYYPDKYEDMAYVYQYINERYHTLLFNDLEADDLLSMLQREEDTFIFSHDKDLKQVTGFHFDMANNLLKYTTEEQGLILLLEQMLIGDTTDNIGGLAGFGLGAFVKFQIANPDITSEGMFYLVLKKYIDKFGVLEGVDTFTEMWSLLSMKLDRGDWFRQKYASAYDLIDEILK